MHAESRAVAHLTGRFSAGIQADPPVEVKPSLPVVMLFTTNIACIRFWKCPNIWTVIEYKKNSYRVGQDVGPKLSPSYKACVFWILASCLVWLNMQCLCSYNKTLHTWGGCQVCQSLSNSIQDEVPLCFRSQNSTLLVFQVKMSPVFYEFGTQNVLHFTI